MPGPASLGASAELRLRPAILRDNGEPVATPMDGQHTDMDQDGEHDSSEGKWNIWTRKKANWKTDVNRIDRVSRPRALLSLRPLKKFSIHAIPKNTLANLIGTLAPSAEMAELATYRYDKSGNCVQITVYDQEHANRILGATSLIFQHNGQTVTLPIEIRHIPNRSNSSRGVITVEAGESNEEILNWVRCERAEVISAQRIGKTNRAILTFDAPEVPKVVKYYMAIVKVSPYQPKRMVCFSCHQIGHMARHCPHPQVCRDCGRAHEEGIPCGRTLFCAACKKEGHLAVDPRCSARVPAPSIQKQEKTQNGVSWADMVTRNGRPATGTKEPQIERGAHVTTSQPLASDIHGNGALLTQLAEMRSELRALREENAQLRSEIAELKRSKERTPPSQSAPKSGQPERSHLQPPRGRTPSVPRRSRSTTAKQTATSQPASNVMNEILQALKYVRADVQQERRARLTDIEKLKSTIDSFSQQASSMMRYIESLPTSQEDPPPRKVTARSTLGQ